MCIFSLSLFFEGVWELLIRAVVAFCLLLTILFKIMVGLYMTILVDTAIFFYKEESSYVAETKGI